MLTFIDHLHCNRLWDNLFKYYTLSHLILLAKSIGIKQQKAKINWVKQDILLKKSENSEIKWEFREQGLQRIWESITETNTGTKLA